MQNIEHKTFSELREDAAVLGSKLLIEIMGDLATFRANKKPQSFYEGEFPANLLQSAPKLDARALSIVDWTLMDEQNIYNRWRACENVRTTFRGMEVTIQKMVGMIVLNRQAMPSMP